MIAHPQIVHFPIAILIVALIFEVITYFWKKETFTSASLILLIIGTAGAFISIQTGQTAADIAKKITGIGSTLHEHEETAELVFYLYLGITVVKAGLMYLKKDILPWRMLIVSAMLVGTFLLYRAAHYGGQLVYEWGAGVKPILEQYDKQRTDQ